MVQLSHSYMITGKTIAYLYRPLSAKRPSSLLFNKLSRFVIAFLSWSKCLLISWLQSSPAVILDPKKIKSLTVPIVCPSICHEVMSLDAMILVFWMLSFKPVFLPSHFHKEALCFLSFWLVPICFLSLGWCYLHIWDYWYFLISTCESSSLAFCMVLNKQEDNIQPWCSPFPIWNPSTLPCPVLTVASWIAHRFLRRTRGAESINWRFIGKQNHSGHLPSPFALSSIVLNFRATHIGPSTYSARNTSSLLCPCLQIISPAKMTISE